MEGEADGKARGAERRQHRCGLDAELAEGRDEDKNEDGIADDRRDRRNQRRVDGERRLDEGGDHPGRPPGRKIAGDEDQRRGSDSRQELHRPRQSMAATVFSSAGAWMMSIFRAPGSPKPTMSW